MASAPPANLSIRLRRAPTRYEPLNRIAVGGMAEVWRANAIFDGGEEHAVAIKRVIPSMHEPLFRAMFKDEARLGMLLRHPNIVRVYDARDIGGAYIMVMELVDGESLRSLTGKAHQEGRSMSFPLALFITHQVALALSYAHRAHDAKGKPLGIVHRDVSPQNVLLGLNGDVKLTDFGLADASVHEHVRGEDVVGGKIAYLAPGVVRAEGVDHRVDLFALGVVLWEMLAGRQLFTGNNEAHTLNNIVKCDVPSLQQWLPQGADADELIARLVTPDPKDRFPDASALASALERLIHRHAWKIGYEEVATAVRLHRGSEKPLINQPVSALLADELAKFAEAAAGSTMDLGAEPLDPTSFQ